MILIEKRIISHIALKNEDKEYQESISNKKNELFPPKKKITNKQLINKIFAYSPKKKAANKKAEYSTLYPATNSASASGKSNGARFVSAKIDIKKIIPKGNNGKINQIISFCISMISFTLKECDNKITGSTIKLMETSYEII